MTVELSMEECADLYILLAKHVALLTLLGVDDADTSVITCNQLILKILKAK